jgi:hypothetical protein
MSDEDVTQAEDEETATDEAPEAAADDEAPEAAADDGAQADDSAIADNVDGLASEHLTDSKPSPQPEGVEGDPIGDAEQHIASLDMDEERRKLQELQKKL